MNLKILIKKLLPKSYVKFYKLFLKVLINIKYIFTGRSVGKPAVQIYICNKEIKSFLSVNNFLSYFSPTINSNGVIKITLYSNNGNPNIIVVF